ncbi:baseplate tail tube cap [Synechococcus phage S-RS29]|nr:baseplate tail tube cap [Synechococcus phage S-RS29]
MSKSKIFRYPYSAPVNGGPSAPLGDGATGAIDYVMFQRQRINYDDSESNYFGYALPNSGLKTVPNERRVYLAMPKKLQTQYQPQYRQVDLGVAGIAGVAGLNDLSTESLAKTVGGAAAAALPEFATSTIASSINSFSGILGLQGNIDANSIQALTRGRVFNPFKEQIFQNMAFRTHNFQFNFFARSEEEAREIQSIILYFKLGATARLGGAGKDEGFSNELKTSFSGNASSVFTSSNAAKLSAAARFFEVPDSFNIKFLRLDPSGTFSGNNEMHFKIHPSVCTGINVDYTPSGQYTAFKRDPGNVGDGAPLSVPAVNLSMTFTELKLVTQEDIAKGF